MSNNLADYKVGARVKTELSTDGSMPRWDFGFDSGGNSKWVHGVIYHVSQSSKTFSIEYADKSSTLTWNSPLPGHPKFKPGVVIFIDEGRDVKLLFSEPVRAPYDQIPASVLQQIVSAGESRVRRTQREWPYRKHLSHAVSGTPGNYQVDFYWEDDG